MQGPLSQAVAGMCAALLPQVSPRTATGVAEVLRRLDTPLQLAVAGRIKSGKSTLVNALIGRRVAPTDVGECTRLVTRFQYGTVDRIEVVFGDGRRATVPFATDGGIPADLGIDLAGVSHLEAYLTSALLAGITVIDTPGLGSLDAASVSRTEALLGVAERPADDGRAALGADHPISALDAVSQFAVGGAEAVLYVFTQGVRADDTRVLAAFTAATAARDAGPVNALAVLNKVDTIVPETVQGAGGDVREAARILARAQAAVLRPRVADVVPVIGLLAETAETGAFTAADAADLRALSNIDPALFAAMTMAGDLFTEMAAPIDRPTRLRLLQTSTCTESPKRSACCVRSPASRRVSCGGGCWMHRASPSYGSDSAKFSGRGQTASRPRPRSPRWRLLRQPPAIGPNVSACTTPSRCCCSAPRPTSCGCWKR